MTLLCAAGEKKLGSSLTVVIFTLEICIFSSGIPNFSNILEGFWGARVVPDSLTLKIRGCASCAGARVVPYMTVVKESQKLVVEQTVLLQVILY